MHFNQVLFFNLIFIKNKSFNCQSSAKPTSFVSQIERKYKIKIFHKKRRNWNTKKLTANSKNIFLLFKDAGPDQVLHLQLRGRQRG
jgi:hypothetical protein